MGNAVKKELEKNLRAINQNFEFIINGELPTQELVKMEFDSIKLLVNYCEKIALNGESAIEK